MSVFFLQYWKLQARQVDISKLKFCWTSVTDLPRTPRSHKHHISIKKKTDSGLAVWWHGEFYFPSGYLRYCRQKRHAAQNGIFQKELHIKTLQNGWRDDYNLQWLYLFCNFNSTKKKDKSSKNTRNAFIPRVTSRHSSWLSLTGWCVLVCNVCYRGMMGSNTTLLLALQATKCERQITFFGVAAGSATL